MKNKNKKTTEEQIKNSKLKLTDNRTMVLNFLKKSAKPVTIDQIKKSLKEKINMTTIYRILEKFVDAGIIYQTDFRDGKAYFEYQDFHHHHIVCTKCGFKEGIEVCIENTLLQVNRKNKKFSKINNHILEFFGICKKCARLNK